MEETLRIEGREYTLVAKQRGGTAVYRGEEEYLRIGPPEVIEPDLTLHKEMETAGFPVAKLKGEGFLEEQRYFREESLGEKRLTDLFQEDTRSLGSISSEHFGQLLTITTQFFAAQLQTQHAAGNESFRTGIKIEPLMLELPQYREKIAQRFAEATGRLEKYPYVVSHGDYNPANIYPKGIIDLEDSFIGPIGFDVVSALITNEWFPDGDFEFIPRYRFSDDQKKTYMQHFNAAFANAGLASLFDIAEDLAFARAIWLAVGMQKWPKLQKWRFDKLVDDYLS